MRYFMQLAYNGTGFFGWQIQPQEPTVQGEIEKALQRLLHEKISITGAGRTDTGVNASMMIAHFDTGLSLPADLPYRLNCLLGKNIAIKDIRPVPADAHARFDATSRTYHYYVCTCKSPFLYPLSWQAPPGLDFEAMNRAAKYLIGRQDFTSFSKLHTQVKTNICTITRAEWQQCSPDGDVWRFVITADRFLRNMVRAIVGTLIDVGRGKMPPEAVAEIMARRDRCSAGTSMPPYALFLHKITYSLPDKTSMVHSADI